MKKLLWVGDAGCPSGFARATHETLDVLRYSFDVTVLGINYRGDPHSYSYPIYAAAIGGDAFGVGRLIWMCDLVKPDVIVLQNDPWNIPHYLKKLAAFPEYADVPVVASIAVDGKNCAAGGLNGLSAAVFWSQFGLDEARHGGYTGPAAVIPLGVDLKAFYPENKLAARKRRGLETLQDRFIVGNVNRNQPRKRWDLTIKYFAEWVLEKRIDDAFLYLHVAPTGDTGTSVAQLAKYYGVLERLILMEPQTWYGVEEPEMRDTYNSFDLQISTTQGEGFGLTTFEGMACGVPQIVPNWAALGELTDGAARLVSCTSTAIGPPYVNVVGGVADEEEFIVALDDMYCDIHERAIYSANGLRLVNEEKFRWQSIGDEWLKTLSTVVREEVTA